MKALWPELWQILRFRQGPENAPSSTALMLLVLLLDLAMSIGSQLMAQELPPLTGAFIPVITLTVELSALLLLMKFKSVSDNFIKTATVIFGGDLILTLLALPLVMITLSLPEKSPLIAGLGVLNLILVGWGLAFRAFVYQRSLNVGIIQAYMLVLSLMLLSMTFCTLAFPDLLARIQTMEQH